MLTGIALGAVLTLQAKKPTFTSDPNQVQIVTEDIDRFYQVLETTSDADLEQRLKADYLKKGTQGLVFFSVAKIQDVKKFAAYVQKKRSHLMEIKPRLMRIKEAEKRIRASFYAFKFLYPDAVFPPIYFVVGRETSGGTAGDQGLMLGAEMDINDPAITHEIVAHELIHFNQKMGSNGLRDSTISEGSADFIGELISGGNINSSVVYPHGYANEKKLWIEWMSDVANGNKVKDWIGSWGQKEPRPGDLGYFVGYRITQAYYNKSTDKLKAVREILTATDAKKFVEESGYDPKLDPDKQKWSGQRDSNPRPTPWQGVALPLSYARSRK
jgi:uncharacterized protein YjaZ